MVWREEKRKSPRSVYERPIQYEMSSLGAVALQPVKRDGFGVDISEHGLGIFTDQPLKKDDVLMLHFPLDSIKTTLPVFARVAWAIPVRKKYRVGMQFLA